MAKWGTDSRVSSEKWDWWEASLPSERASGARPISGQDGRAVAEQTSNELTDTNLRENARLVTSLASENESHNKTKLAHLPICSAWCTNKILPLIAVKVSSGRDSRRGTCQVLYYSRQTARAKP